VSELQGGRNVTGYSDVSEVQGGRKITVYSDVCLRYRVGESLLCIVMCV